MVSFVKLQLKLVLVCVGNQFNLSIRFRISVISKVRDNLSSFHLLSSKAS